jgi:hypothetical protein
MLMKCIMQVLKQFQANFNVNIVILATREFRFTMSIQSTQETEN